MYYGFNPQKIGSSAVLIRSMKRGDAENAALYKLSRGTYRLMYQAEKDGLVIDMYLNGVSNGNYSYFNDFLHNFRACKSIGNSVECKDYRIFDEEVFKRSDF